MRLIWSWQHKRGTACTSRRVSRSFSLYWWLNRSGCTGQASREECCALRLPPLQFHQRLQNKEESGSLDLRDLRMLTARPGSRFLWSGCPLHRPLVPWDCSAVNRVLFHSRRSTRDWLDLKFHARGSSEFVKVSDFSLFRQRSGALLGICSGQFDLLHVKSKWC